MHDCIHEHHPQTTYTQVHVRTHLCVREPSHSASVCASIHVCVRPGARPTVPFQTLLPSPKSLPVLLRNSEGTVFWANVPFTSPHGLACLLCAADPRSLVGLFRTHTTHIPASHPFQFLLRPLLGPQTLMCARWRDLFVEGPVSWGPRNWLSGRQGAKACLRA